MDLFVLDFRFLTQLTQHNAAANALLVASLRVSLLILKQCHPQIRLFDPRYIHIATIPPWRTRSRST